ncbi:MAG TPA: glutaredoxin family protein [bacterium]|nr:glutaredoxin family protein [bacterium]HPJ73028.1 glutaredoxin family protein [bacterium]HPQ67091.1 glutaredoxin family protein [bacterium]
MENPRITIWALSTCIHCRRAARLLDQLEVPYRKVEVDLLSGEERARALEEMSRHNPERSFPTLLIGEEVIVGNIPERIREAVNRDASR